jgi:hypothetical protein
MESLSVCAEMTSGTVNIVNPLELVRQIRLISQNPVIATGVAVKLILPKSFVWNPLEEEQKDKNKKKEKETKKKKKKAGDKKFSNFLEQNIGNVTDASNLSFPYVINPKVIFLFLFLFFVFCFLSFVCLVFCYFVLFIVLFF